MNFTPTPAITEKQLHAGMHQIVRDGVSTEIMTVLSGGAFLVAMALLLGATNFQIGLIAALPTFMNLFQLVSLWLVRRFRNRKAISVFCSVLARVPLILIGCIPLLMKQHTGVEILIFFLCFFYLFGSIAGPAWNSWMKDLIPEKQLGSFFSRRTKRAQTVNVIVSLLAALCIDYVKHQFPAYELNAYSYMYIAAGCFGLMGVFFLYRTPETPSLLSNQHLFTLLAKPLRNKNFKNLLIFNSAWSFALAIASPFFTVYMMQTLGLSISYVIGFTIISQLSSIFTVKIWGMYADRYSNKTIIAIGGPLYILCLIGWCFVGIFPKFYSNLALLALINILTGISTAGINLSLTNIGLKLAPNEDSIVYLSAKNIIVAIFSSVAPLLGGYLADYFSQRHLDINTVYAGPNAHHNFHLLSLHQFNFLFLMAALLGFIALQLLARVREQGEVEKNAVVRIIRSSIRNSAKDNFIFGTLLDIREHVSSAFTRFFQPSDIHDQQPKP